MALPPASSASVDDFLNHLVMSLYTMARGGAGIQLPVAVISDPASVQAILAKPGLFAKSLGLLGDWGDSRFNTNGNEWETRKALTQRAYLSAGANHNADRTGTIYQTRIDRAEASLDGIHRALMLAATETFFAAFDCTVDVERLLVIFERARPHIRRLQFFTWHPLSAFEREGLRDEADGIARDFEREVRQSRKLMELIASFRESAAGIDRFDPFHELLMNFFAGIETTAATLCFAVDRLGVDARVQQRVYEEILQGNEDKYANCLIMETLRYFPTVPFVVRRATESANLGSLVINKDQQILVSIVGLHHDAKSWKEPEIFDASRAEFLNDSYDRRAFLPFLAGPRMCGGARLANLELREGLRALVRRFETTNDSEDVGFDYGITLRPRAAGSISFRRRS